MPPKLSISIVHHHGRKMLRDCLKSIYSNSPEFEFEIVVVDNLSEDGSIAMIETDFSHVQLIKNRERHGFGQNQNTGIKNCSGDYILVLNDDTLLQPRALEQMCEFLDEHPETGIVGPKLLNVDGSLQTSCYRFPTPMRHIWDNFLLSTAFPDSTIFGDYRQWDYGDTRVVDCVKGAAMLVRKSAIEQVGGFDEQFFMYFEEIDWQLRMHRAGFDIVFLPHAQIIHLDGGSSTGSNSQKFSEFQISSIKLAKKHYGAIGVAIQAASILCGSVISILLWSTIRLVSPHRASLQIEASRQIERSLSLLLWWAGASSRNGLSSAVAAKNAK